MAAGAWPRWHRPGSSANCEALEPTGEGGAATELQEVSREGPQAHKAFIGVSGGTRMRPFIYFGFRLSLFNMSFQGHDWIFKETGLPFAGDGTLCFPQSRRRHPGFCDPLPQPP